MKPLVFHPEAEAEYYAQQDYYESQQTGLGLRFAQWATAHYRVLAANPRAFPVKWKVRHCYMSIFPFDIVFEDPTDETDVFPRP